MEAKQRPHKEPEGGERGQLILMAFPGSEPFDFGTLVCSEVLSGITCVIPGHLLQLEVWLCVI